MPLTAQGDTIGLLYFEERPELATAHGAPRVFLDLMADNVALALANQRLRERLASLAEHDGLTGLLNRRRLDETLLALDPAAPLACLMVDIDHFKRSTTTSATTPATRSCSMWPRSCATRRRASARPIGSAARNSRSCCPASTRPPRTRWRNGSAPGGHASLAHHGRMLDRVSISLGVSASPADGPATTLVRSADAALLQAKASGRNRTVSAADLPGPPRNRRSAVRI